LRADRQQPRWAIRAKREHDAERPLRNDDRNHAGAIELQREG